MDKLQQRMTRKTETIEDALGVNHPNGILRSKKKAQLYERLSLSLTRP